MKKIFLLALCGLVLFAVGCGPKDDTQPTDAPNDGEEQNGDVQNSDSQNGDNANNSEEPSAPDIPDRGETIQATLTMEDGGVIVLELYPDIAPESVRNFVYLVRQGYYDGLKFHRIIEGFMIQGGCPEGTGTGGPGYHIFGEFAENGFMNDLQHVRGILSMARAQDYNSGGSQFFIMHSDHHSLDGAYAAFGSVVSGMDVVDRIAETPVTGGSGAVAPENMPVISSITIDSDIELPEPEKLP